MQQIRLFRSIAIALAFITISLSTTSAADNTPIYKVKVPKKMVALTFDDGPDNNVPKIIKLLQEYDAKATFFVVGNKVQKFPDAAKQIIHTGNEIGNHSFTHPSLPKLTPEKIREEIESTQKIIKKIAGFTPVLFRAPNLQYSDELWKVIHANNLQAVNSSPSVEDWNRKTTKEQIIERSTVHVSPGGIVLMHTWPGKTVEALPAILTYLKENGDQLVTLSEILKASGKQ